MTGRGAQIAGADHMPPEQDAQISTTVATALGDMKAVLATVAADVRAVLGRLDDQARVQQDHEQRLRAIEQNGCPSGIYGRRALGETGADIETRVRSLERWRWSIPSAAVILSLASIGVTIWTGLR